MLSKPLIAYQACFVVDDVEQAMAFCASTMGWGPFQHFKIPSAEANYHGWQGQKLTEVALGMAGRAQVELIHVHEGHDAIEQYQHRLGSGLQHLGVLCKSTDEALAHLQPLGGVVNDRNQYGEITFTFMDVPTGPAMIELLERGEQGLPTAEENDNGEKIGLTSASKNERLVLDRATVVTHDIRRSAAFFEQTFGSARTVIESDTLRFENAEGDLQETPAKRCLIDSGVLSLELVEVSASGTNPYAQQLQRGRLHGNHGLVHVGGVNNGTESLSTTESGLWLKREERFKLCSGPDARQSLQLRLTAD